MAGLLEQLENNEAVLLLYLAGELPAEDRAEVEQMLARDGALRATLRELSDAQAASAAALAALDGGQGLPMSEDSAVRRVVRAWRQRELEMADRAETDRAGQGAPEWPRWAYVGLAAAIVLIGFLAWWGIRPFEEHPFPPRAPVVSRSNSTLPEMRLSEEEPLDVAERHAVALSNAADEGLGIVWPREGTQEP